MTHSHVLSGRLQTKALIMSFAAAPSSTFRCKSKIFIFSSSTLLEQVILEVWLRYARHFQKYFIPHYGFSSIPTRPSNTSYNTMGKIVWKDFIWVRAFRFATSVLSRLSSNMDCFFWLSSTKWATCFSYSRFRFFWYKFAVWITCY